MTRHADWEHRLQVYLEAVRTHAFEWGKHDCCLFAAGGVDAATGVDHMAEFRGRYRSAAGAARLVHKIGGGTLEAAMDTKLAPISPSLAQRGDVVMAADEMGSKGLGLAIGPVALFVGAEGSRDGLVTIPRAQWLRAWAVR